MNLLIDRLLNHSGYRWGPENFYPMVDFFEAQPDEDQAEFIRVSKAMPNAKFESTVYWGIISGRVASRDRRCKLCANPNGLQAHHQTYAHRGEEHRYLKDMIALCKLCHVAQHEHAILNLAKKQYSRDGNKDTVEQIANALRQELGARRLLRNKHLKQRSPWD